MEVMMKEAAELKQKRMADAKELKRKMLYVAITSDKGIFSTDTYVIQRGSLSQFFLLATIQPTCH